jgi:hypothetical protein
MVFYSSPNQMPLARAWGVAKPGGSLGLDLSLGTDERQTEYG